MASMATMSLAEQRGGGIGPVYARHVLGQLRPDERMLDELAKYSGDYVLRSTMPEDPLRALFDKFADWLSANDAESFDAELARLVVSEGSALLDQFRRLIPEHRPSSPHERDMWPLVATALEGVIGADGADAFHDGLALLSWRSVLSRENDEIHEHLQRSKPPPKIEVPDPELSALKYATLAGDVCFVAVVVLLGLRREVPGWFGLELARRFCEGQRAGVQVLASALVLCAGETTTVKSAIRFAGVELIDIEQRYRSAKVVDSVVRGAAADRPPGAVVALFPGEDPTDEYPDDDPDEWGSDP